VKHEILFKSTKFYYLNILSISFIPKNMSYLLMPVELHIIKIVNILISGG